VRVLLADDDAERASALAGILAADPGITVLRLSSDQTLADAVTALQPDIVLVDMARPDRDALDGIRQVAAYAPRPVVLFVDEDDPHFMEEAIGAGVSSYNVLGVPPLDVKPILRAAAALFRRHQEAQHGRRTAELQLEERQILDRAKALLIKKRNVAEPQAYRWLRNEAMSSGRRIVDVAADVIRQHEGKTQ
jgi:two-component system, response regulator / RNA-binding antiterminator